MSADNWAYCPKCQSESALEDDDAKNGPRLREDYEQGMNLDVEYCVYYKCQCRDCGFSWQYHHKEQVLRRETT